MLGAVTLGVMYAVLTIAVHYLDETYARWEWLSKSMDGRFGFAVSLLVLSLPFLAAALAGMLVRDAIVHWMVRRLIKRRGSCRRCGYSLRGLVVPADLRIACPECGQVTLSSPALHELAVDADGRNIIKDAAE